MSNNKLIYNISKVARNTLQKDLIKSLEIIHNLVVLDIERYKELIFIPFFNTEQLEKYEKFMDLSVEKGWSLEDRRDRIIYTLLSKSTFTPETLKEQAKIFTNGEIEIIEDFSDYSFLIKFTSIVGIPRNIDNFKRFIELNKPAHLNYALKFRYNTHKQIAYKLHSELKNKTHKEILETRLFEDYAVYGKYNEHYEFKMDKHSMLKTKTHRELYEERR